MASENVARPPDADAKAAPREATTAATGWRRWVPWALVVLACVLALVAALNVWVKRQALNTDNFANASSQLIEDPAIRSAVSVYLVNQLYQNVDVGQALEQRLPPVAKPLAPTIASALQPALIRSTDTLLGRPRVQQAFEQAVRRAHQLFIAVLDGKHELLVSTNGNVVLDLRPILEQLVNQTGIGERLLQQLPPDAGQITVMKGDQLGTARKGVKVVRAMSYFLLFLVLALIAAAMWIARGRRRTILFASGVGIVIAGLVILIVHRLAGSYIVDALTTNPDAKKPVTAVWAIETQLLRNVGRQHRHLRRPRRHRSVDRRAIASGDISAARRAARASAARLRRAGDHRSHPSRHRPYRRGPHLPPARRVRGRVHRPRGVTPADESRASRRSGSGWLGRDSLPCSPCSRSPSLG